jgi:hypothetical protein
MGDPGIRSWIFVFHGRIYSLPGPIHWNVSLSAWYVAHNLLTATFKFQNDRRCELSYIFHTAVLTSPSFGLCITPKLIYQLCTIQKAGIDTGTEL